MAVVDVGSRSIRLAIGEFRPDQPMRRLETLTASVAIGVDTFSRGRIRALTTEAVVKTLRDFSLVVGAYGLKPADCRAVATTAVRDAPNRDVFLDQVEKRTGFQIQVLEAIEETRLARQLMRHLIGPTLDEGTVLLLGLGAGGTHIVVQTDGEISLAESRSFGIFKLLEGRPASQAIRGAAPFLQKVVSSLGRLHPLKDVRSITVISGELHRLVGTLGRSKRHPWGLELGKKQFEALSHTIDALTLREVAEESGLEFWLAESARMAFEELRAFAAPCAAERIFFPDCSMLDSLLLDGGKVFAEGGRAAAIAMSSAQTAESAAWAVAKRYLISQSHARHVRWLALQLFDGLQQFTGLGERSRLLLAVAAILHDIGIFVSTHEHERHSAYLIENSEVMGIRGAELLRIAMIVRHHRHPFRDIDTRDLGPMNVGDRLEVLKLTAILRLADALDANHHRRVERIEIHPTADELQIIAETHAGEREGLVELQRAFDEKADLGEEIFGMRPRLIEVLAT